MFLQSHNNLATNDYLSKIDKVLGIQNIRHSFAKYKERKLAKSLKREAHLKRKEFFRVVLKKLPFLYFKSQEMEEYQWTKLAYELHLRGFLIPELVRYQVGPTFFVSFGSIANQLKREFYLMLLDNDTSNVYNLNFINKEKIGKFKFSGFYQSPPMVSDSDLQNFKYFTPEEIRNIILSGDRLNNDFEETECRNDESCSDWYNTWGWVYETEPDCYRAVDMQIGNYRLELEALELLLQLGLSDAELPHMDGKYFAVADLINAKKASITESHMPSARMKQERILDKLQKCKRFSDSYNKLLNY